MVFAINVVHEGKIRRKFPVAFEQSVIMWRVNGVVVVAILILLESSHAENGK